MGRSSEVSREDLQSRLEAVATTRRGDHPLPEDLLDYHLGESASEDAEMIEDHLTYCAECAQHVLDMSRFLCGDLAGETNEDLASEEEGSAEPTKPTNSGTVSVMPWAKESSPRPQGAGSIRLERFFQVAAALFFLCSVGLTGYIFSFSNHSGQALSQSIANVPIHELSSLDVRGTDVQSVELKKDMEGAVLVFPLAGVDAYSSYTLSFSDANGEISFSQSNLRRTSQGLLSLFVSREFLPRGNYVVSIQGLASDGEEHELSQFSFRWQPEP